MSFQKPSSVIDPQGRRVLPNVSIETSIIVDKIKALARPNQQVEIVYADTLAWIGRDIRSVPGYLASAKRILLRDHNILVETIRGVGLMIGAEADKIGSSARDMGRARRALGRASRKLAAVEYRCLTEEEKREFNARSSVIGALKLLGTTAAVKKVAAASPSDMLPSAKVLDLLRG